MYGSVNITLVFVVCKRNYLTLVDDYPNNQLYLRISNPKMSYVVLEIYPTMGNGKVKMLS